MLMTKLHSVHSIRSYWKSKRMLATYTQCMGNSNLEIRITASSCRLQKLQSTQLAAEPQVIKLLHFVFHG